MKVPNFFIIGAPKCGTTSLSYWLSEHPNIFFSPIKEPYYWCTDFNIYSAIRDKITYFALFNEATLQHKAIGEASVWYLYSNVAIQNIEKELPNSKYIVLLRNPIDMLYSLYWHQIYSGVENISDFIEAWRASEDRRNYKRLKVSPEIYDPKLLDYKSIGMLGFQLKRLYQFVTSDRILVILFDDLKKDPKRIYLKVLNFLEVPFDNRTYFPKYNTAKQIRFPILRTIQLKLGLSESKVRKLLRFYSKTRFFDFVRKIISIEKSKPPLPKKVKRELIDFYKDDIILLSELLNRDLSDWLKCV